MAPKAKNQNTSKPTTSVQSTANVMQHNPLRKARRCVKCVDILPDGIIAHETKSFTNNKDTWHPHIDIENLSVYCDCPDFKFRIQRHEPTLDVPVKFLCKHLIAAILGAERRHYITLLRPRRKELQEALNRKPGFSKPAKEVAEKEAFDVNETRPCHICGVVGAPYRVCDESGKNFWGRFVCADCAPSQESDGQYDGGGNLIEDEIPHLLHHDRDAHELAIRYRARLSAHGVQDTAEITALNAHDEKVRELELMALERDSLELLARHPEKNIDAKERQRLNFLNDELSPFDVWGYPLPTAQWQFERKLDEDR